MAVWRRLSSCFGEGGLQTVEAASVNETSRGKFWRGCLWIPFLAFKECEGVLATDRFPSSFVPTLSPSDKKHWFLSRSQIQALVGPTALLAGSALWNCPIVSHYVLSPLLPLELHSDVNPLGRWRGFTCTFLLQENRRREKNRCKFPLVACVGRSIKISCLVIILWHPSCLHMCIEIFARRIRQFWSPLFPMYSCVLQLLINCLTESTLWISFAVCISCMLYPAMWS
jgi:hypothetical protein